jgi:hypothetical protein
MANTKINRPLVWLRRYLPAEALGVAALLLGALTTLAVTGNVLLAALAGGWLEALAYYGVLIVRALWSCERITPRLALTTLRNLVLEFGPAELLDSVLVRPAALAGGLAFAPNPVLGVLAGKLAADMVFYLPTILSFEALRRANGLAEKEVAKWCLNCRR